MPDSPVKLVAFSKLKLTILFLETLSIVNLIQALTNIFNFSSEISLFLESNYFIKVSLTAFIKSVTKTTVPADVDILSPSNKT